MPCDHASPIANMLAGQSHGLQQQVHTDYTFCNLQSLCRASRVSLALKLG